MSRWTLAVAVAAWLVTGCGGGPAGEFAATASRAETKGAAAMQREDGSFETDRLIIRRFVRGDWAGIQELGRDKESSETAAWDHRWPTSEEGCKEAADYFAKRDTSWAVCLKDGKRLIGLISFNGIDDDKRLDLGHLFHTKFNSQDYDTEALRRMMDHAFTRLGVQAIYGDNAEEWTAQLTPLKKLGMTLVEPPAERRGKKSSFRKRPDGTPIEFVGCRLQITREEWRRRRGKAAP